MYDLGDPRFAATIRALGVLRIRGFVRRFAGASKISPGQALLMWFACLLSGEPYAADVQQCILDELGSDIIAAGDRIAEAVDKKEAPPAVMLSVGDQRWTRLTLSRGFLDLHTGEWAKQLPAPPVVWRQYDLAAIYVRRQQALRDDGGQAGA